MKPNRSAIRHRLPRYAALAATAAGASPLLGQIIYFNSTHSFGGSQSWDIDGNGTMDFSIQLTDSHISTFNHQDTMKIWGYGTGPFPNANFNFNKLAAQGAHGILPLLAGAVIGASRNFLGGGNTSQRVTHNNATSSPLTGGTQYLGFRFLISGTVHYGWASVTIAPGTAETMTVNEWAYNSVINATIQAGATPIPEPATTTTGLGLLALGAAGVARYKRRRAAG